MLNCDNKPSIYLCLQINSATLGVKSCFFGIIYVSLWSKSRQSNAQNLCISPLMLQHILPLSGNTSVIAIVLLQGVDPGLLVFHSITFI